MLKGSLLLGGVAAIVMLNSPLASAKEIAAKAEKVRGATNLSTIYLEGDTLFAFNDDKLTAQGKAALDKLLKSNVLSPTNRYSVTGFTDRIGLRDANTQLSFRRAESVKNYLYSKNANLRLEPAGRGPDLPRVECSDKLERQALIKCLAPNRRVEIDQVITN